ncbi:MAG: ECF transporter S component [Eubacterium sp.]|nr:ECF transporter S component [Eubacterium sp.]
MKLTSTKALIFMALSVVINFIGCFLALVIRVPIYLDSIGTVLAATALGPLGGAVVGALTSLINGITTDPVSLYFMPTQVVLGIMAGIFFGKLELKGAKAAAAVFFMGVVVSILSSFIVALVFGGVTSSSSSLIVAFLKNMGVDLWLAVFVTQIVTDVIDKYVCVGLAFAIARALPMTLRQKFSL